MRLKEQGMEEEDRKRGVGREEEGTGKGGEGTHASLTP